MAQAKPNLNRMPYEFTTAEIDQFLRSGEHAEALAGYFGAERYRQLTALARVPVRRATRRRQRVFILPGIMASMIGTKRSRLLPDEVVWINPVTLAFGKAKELSFDLDPIDHEALDVIPYFYYYLRKRLSNEGYDVEYFYYDWRYDLETLAEQLATKIKNDAADSVDLVAHSMGGLVSRLALRDADANAKISRLIMLGTPNHGSFNAIQVFDGTHSVTQKVEQMDLRHDMNELITQVFSTLPAVYQLLPFEAKFGNADIYDQAKWPDNMPKPRQDLLDRAKEVSALYPAPDERHFLIASTAHPTYVGIRMAPDGLVYEYADANGDGTVPLESALLPGVKTRYVGSEHQDLANDDDAINTVVSLLQTQPDAWTTESAPVTRGSRSRQTINTSELKTRTPPPRDAFASPAEHRNTLNALFGRVEKRDEPPSIKSIPPSGMVLGKWQGLTIGERPRRRVEITLAKGDLTAAEVPVSVLGMFQNVRPTGAARAIDEKMNGALSEIFSRRMFNAQSGEIFILPSPSRRIGSAMILFAGLGSFDQLDDQAYQFTAANIMRTLLRCRVTEFASVVFGSNSTMSPKDALTNMLRGFWNGLADVDPEQRFRRLVLCEIDPVRYEELKAELLNLSISGFFSPAEVVLDEIVLDAEEVARRTAASIAATPATAPSAYLSVRSDSDANIARFDYSLLSPGGKATVFQEPIQFPTANLNQLLSKIGVPGFDVDDFGKQLVELVLPKGIREILFSPQAEKTHLTIINDAGASRVPWETLQANKRAPVLKAGLSRQYATGGLSVAKWLEQTRNQKKLSMLMIVDPTEDLPGARTEADAIQQVLTGIPDLELAAPLKGPAATRKAVLDLFASGKYDVIHYAGHASFDANDPTKSGLYCADGVLTGPDLVTLPALPTLLFFNACESARVRKAKAKPVDDPETRLKKAVSLAESFLVNGISQLIGTYWPVSDAGAATFAKVFYTELVQAKPMGEALIAARHALHKAKQADWANYIHYGDPNFSIKKPSH